MFVSETTSATLNVIMAETYRSFDAGPDPFGRTWHVEFRWLQTGISIRHADTVDVKFVMWNDEDLETEGKQEKILALPHPALLKLSEETGHPLTDPWCMKLAAKHLMRLISDGDDLDKTLIHVPLEVLRIAAGASQPV